LQTAVLLELHTIPLYLYAAYSIKQGSPADFILIAKQEMLHLGLAGNMLRSIGGRPQIYGEGFTPEYPSYIFYEKRVKMEMKPATKEHIQTFVDLEAPTPQMMANFAANLLPDYHTIGEFYEETIRGLRILDKKFKEEGKALFDPATVPFQFNSHDGSWHAEDMTAIADFQTALKAITFIVEQGEGSTGKGTVESHYDMFKRLKKADLGLYPVVDNPITNNFRGQKVHKLMLAYDATYCFLLLTIERLWTYDGNLRAEIIDKNIRNLMGKILGPLARVLVTQPLGNGKNAGPPHNLYIFQDTIQKTPLQELRVLIAAALESHPGDGLLNPVAGAVGDLHELPGRK